VSEAEYCDVVVVGTGAGGGILAHKLARSGLRTISLEHGAMLPEDHFRTTVPPGVTRDFGIDPSTTWPSDPHDSLFVHPLFANGSVGSTARPKDGFRHFQVLAVNGLQNLWNGVSVRFSAEDFGSWPLSYGEMAPHYGAVERLIAVCGTKEGLTNLPDGDYLAPKPLRPADRMIVDAVRSLNDGHSHAIPNRKAINTKAGTPTSCISTGMCTSGCPVGAVYKFSTRLLPQIADLPNYELRTQAKVVRLIREGRGRRVEGVEYIDLATGARRLLRAGIVVLAAGALETPRILFNSADEVDPSGFGNRHERVGAGLQDNPKVVLSTSLLKLWGKRRDYDLGYGDLLILLSQGKLPDGSPFPFIGHAIHSAPDVPHYLTGMRHFPPFLKERLARTMFHSYVTLGLFCQGVATPSNRVRPGSSVDAFGVRQVEVDFTIPEASHQMMDAMAVWGRRVLRKASATMIYASRDNSGTGIHYAGTTAMAEDPRHGVVDADLKSHDLDNLYICDGGVIPQLPDKHLTLTIMALADRLGGHLIATARQHSVAA
jgi:choline dehydrogenase-like flavoprotein